MQAFSNDKIKDHLCGGCDCTGFAPAVNFNYNSGAKTITFTDATVYPTGDTRKVVHVTVYDKEGVKVLGNIASDDVDHAIVVSTATLEPSEGFTLLATVISSGGCLSDGHAKLVGVAITQGALGSWDKDNDSIIVGESASGSAS